MLLGANLAIAFRFQPDRIALQAHQQNILTDLVTVASQLSDVKVHNIIAGTDIFSFRILRTIQFLVHGLT